MSCACASSDSWSCAVSRGLSIPCTCDCHLGLSVQKEPPIVRNTDPGTSRRAAAKHSLVRAERQRQVLTLVVDHPDLTDGEYARLMLKTHPELPVKIAVETPHKRLSDLAQKGFVAVSGRRVCSDSGYECQTYKATAAGINEIRRTNR